MDNIIETTLIYGEILEIEDNKVSILCLISEGVTQERFFDLKPLESLDLTIGNVVSINTTIKSGSIFIEFKNESEDKKSLFEKEDPFKGLENSSFFVVG